MEEKWIPVWDHMAETMPEEDCEVYITRASSIRDRWVQKINYWVEQGCFDWDGTIAWMPIQSETPKPYEGRIRVVGR